jgi:hypothetical protein
VAALRVRKQAKAAAPGATIIIESRSPGISIPPVD